MRKETRQNFPASMDLIGVENLGAENCMPRDVTGEGGMILFPTMTQCEYMQLSDMISEELHHGKRLSRFLPLSLWNFMERSVEQ